LDLRLWGVFRGDIPKMCEVNLDLREVDEVFVNAEVREVNSVFLRGQQRKRRLLRRWGLF